MKYSEKVLSRTKVGLLVFSEERELYHLTFGNFYLELTKNQLHYFRVFLCGLNFDSLQKPHNETLFKRKLTIPTQQSNLFLILTVEELDELEKLIFYENINYQFKSIKSNEVDYDNVAN